MPYPMAAARGGGQQPGGEPAGPTDWWDIAGHTVVWAYQPKGADSLAASYTDLSGNGNDAAPGTAPTWNATDGWLFNGTNQYLTTPVVPSDEGSLFIRYTNAVGTNLYLVGVYHSATQKVGLVPLFSSDRILYENEGAIAVSPDLAGGVLGVAGRKAYRNGVQEAGNIPAGTVPTGALYIGARNRMDITTIDQFCACEIQAAVMYSTTLSAGDASDLYDNMAAL